jgi:hypothetical protein
MRSCLRKKNKMKTTKKNKQGPRKTLIDLAGVMCSWSLEPVSLRTDPGRERLVGLYQKIGG